MNYMDALRNMRQLQANTIVVLCSNVILALALTFAMVRLADVHDRVILVPPNLDKKATIAWEYADKEYLKSFGLYMATLVGNIQPKSSMVVLDSVSAFMDPAIYTSFRQQLLTIINDPVFKASGSVISFLPSSIQYESETSRVFVTGSIITNTAGSTKYQKNVIYELVVRIREGRPWVTHFTSYEGTEIHSVKWWALKNTRDGTVIPQYALPTKWRKDGDSIEVESDFSVMRPSEELEAPKNEGNTKGVELIELESAKTEATEEKANQKTQGAD